MANSSMINELGNKYGSLTVIKYAKDKNGRGAWLCQCDCGNTKIVRGTDLRSGRITHCSYSCPCKLPPAFIDETGNQYGYLTVLYKSSFNDSNRKIIWHCKCVCGKECDVVGVDLRNGSTKSCGCKSLELLSISQSKDLTNQIFGFLIPIEIVKRGGPEGNEWKCECTCGCNRKDLIVSSSRLLSGNTTSCGNSRTSRGEHRIENFLKDNKIFYIKEYSFNDLYSVASNKKLRFDFAIFKNEELKSLIEFDGEQHFKPVDYFGGEEKYQIIKANDILKNQYCIKNNIPLLRIPFHREKDIEDILEKFLIDKNILIRSKEYEF